MKWKPAILSICCAPSLQLRWCELGSFPRTSDQRKNANKVKIWLPDPVQKETFLRYSTIGGWVERDLSFFSQALNREDKSMVWLEGTTSPLQGERVQILGVIIIICIYRVIIGLCRPPPGPGPPNEGGRHTGEGSPGECNDNSSSRPRFVRGNKKITSQNKYYLSYSLKKGKLMPRHHA